MRETSAVAVLGKVPVSRNQVLAGGGDRVAEYPRSKVAEVLPDRVHVELETLDELPSTKTHALTVFPPAFIDPPPIQ